MNPTAAPFSTRALAVGVLAFAVALLARIALQAQLGNQFGFTFFVPAICIVAWKVGRPAGFLSTVLATLTVGSLSLLSPAPAAISDPMQVTQLILFVTSAILVVYFIDRGRRAMLGLESLRERESALRADYEVTLRSIGDAVIATDQTGRITFMNVAAEQLTGWAFAAARGAAAEMVFVIRDELTGVPRTAPIQQVLATRTSVAVENHTVLLPRHGNGLPISHRAAPIFTSDGFMRGVVLVFRDVATQANARRALSSVNTALQQQVDDLRRLHEFNGAALGAGGAQAMYSEIVRAAVTVNSADKALLTVVDSTPDGLRVVASSGFNPEFLQLVEFTQGESGGCGWCYRQRRRVMIDDVQNEPSFEAYRSAAETAGFRALHSTPLIARSGRMAGVISVYFAESRCPTEREVQLMDLYARSAADLIDNVQLREALRHELESRRLTAEELRVATDRFKLAAHADLLTLFEQDRDLRYQWLYPSHPEHTTGLGRTDDELLPKDEAQPLTAAKRAVLATGIAQRIEVQTTLPDGVRYYDMTISPKRNKLGEIDGVAGAAVDVTPRKQAELALTRTKDELARTNLELEERVRQRTASVTELLSQMEAFSYSISHDLRAPLRAVGTFAAVLQEEHSHALNAEGVDMLQRIIRGTERMNRLVNDVLSFTRVNRHEVNFTRVSLEKCLRDVVQNAPELQAPAARVSWPNEMPMVIGSEAFIVQVFSNLLSNAVKFVPAGRTPEVVISTEPRGASMRIWVVDSGIGIKPEHQPRLFGMFERLDAGRHYEGTGMGLAIVRRAVQRMGGAVGVESDGRTGSQFWVELPSAVTAVRHPEPSPDLARPRECARDGREALPLLA